MTILLSEFKCDIDLEHTWTNVSNKLLCQIIFYHVETEFWAA